ncbi:MAG: peptide chain release factor N(5)-glutamine methyltransferase [Clostridia bacterium]|nr:peptide chain release factor N(5)-glutamine methyltransferase [Clostridia bacterium]
MVSFRLRAELAEHLRRFGVETPEKEARMLLCAAWGIPLDRLLQLGAQAEVPGDVEEAARRLVSRRASGEPLQYLLGQWEFYGETFLCSPQALIPRPETELLVTQAIRWAREHPACRTLLDAGCGTGCIGITAALHTGCRPTLLDISKGALALAKRNAKRLSVEAEFVLADLLEGPTGERRWDMLISNPPYLTKKDMACLQREVQYEPETALFGGEDGLLFYRALAEKWISCVSPGGLVLVEHGQGQGEAVSALFRAAGLKKVQTMPDYAGIDRITRGEIPKN